MNVLKPFKDVWLSCAVKEPIMLSRNSFEMGNFVYSNKLKALLAYRVSSGCYCRPNEAHRCELSFNSCLLFLETHALVGKKVSRFWKQTTAPQNSCPPGTLGADLLYPNIAEDKGRLVRKKNFNRNCEAKCRMIFLLTFCLLIASFCQ